MPAPRGLYVANIEGGQHPHRMAQAPYHVESHGTLLMVCDRTGTNWGLDGSGAIGFERSWDGYGDLADWVATWGGKLTSSNEKDFGF